MISLVGCVGPFYKNLCTLGWFVVWSVKRIDILQVFRIGFLRSEPIYTSSFRTLIWNDYKLRKFSP